jgi:hypothetical protein
MKSELNAARGIIEGAVLVLGFWLLIIVLCWS